MESNGRSKLGRVLADRYELKELLGRGGNATTYHAFDRNTDTECAIKELRVAEADSFQAIRLFEREASVLEELDHPAIPRYFDDFRSEGDDGEEIALYIVQEYVSGDTLLEFVEHERRTEAEILELLASVLEILEYLHDRSPAVVHRDVKPEHVIVREDASPALVDFGSVRAAIRPQEKNQTITGTVGYMAPEQYAGRALPASDVYGVAATGIHLLSGNSPSEMLDNHNRLDWGDFTEVKPATRNLFETMLHQNPEKRPADAGDLAENMRAVASGNEDVAEELSESEDRPRLPESAETAAIPSARPTAIARPDWEDRFNIPVEAPRKIPDDFDDRLAARESQKSAFDRRTARLALVLAFFMLAWLGVTAVTGKSIGIGLTLGVAVAVAGCVYHYLTAPTSRRLSVLRNIYEKGVLTTGTVIGSEVDDTWTAATLVRYEFAPSDAGSETLRGETTTLVPKIPAKGDPVPVVYDPENPEDHLGLVDYLS